LSELEQLLQNTNELENEPEEKPKKAKRRVSFKKLLFQQFGVCVFE